MRRYLIALLLGAGLAAPAALPAQDRPAPARRAELEARVFDRFVAVAADRLDLTAEQQTRFVATLKDYAARRRELAGRGGTLRRQLLRALESDATSDVEFRQILGSLEQLRADEQRIWKAEQEALGGILSPRQQAQLVVLRARMIDRVDDIRSRQGPGGRPGRRPPPGK